MALFITRGSIGMNTFLFGLVLGMGTLMFSATPAWAIPVNWTIGGLSFSGGSVTGGFTYDLDSNMYSNIAIVVSGIGTFDTQSASTCCDEAQLAVTVGAPAIGSHFLILNFSSPFLSDAGGTVSISSAMVGTCAISLPCVQISENPEEGSPLGSVRGVPAVPEPGTIALFATGLFGLAGYRWHQRRREGTQLG